jgi:hypothetical protein
MAYVNGHYIQQCMLDAMNACDAAGIRRHAANEDGSISSAYILDACIPYAASKENLALLTLLLGFHDLPYDVTQALGWSDACFKLVLDDVSKKYAAYPKAVAKYPDYLQVPLYMKLATYKGGVHRTLSAMRTCATLLPYTADRIQAILETPLGKSLGA